MSLKNWQRSFGRTADHKGANLPLLSKPAAVLYEHDRDYEPDFSEYQDKPEASDAQHAAIPRPIGLRFQFLEICGGAGKVTQKLVKLLSCLWTGF